MSVAELTEMGGKKAPIQNRCSNTLDDGVIPIFFEMLFTSPSLWVYVGMFEVYRALFFLLKGCVSRLVCVYFCIYIFSTKLLVFHFQQTEIYLKYVGMRENKQQIRTHFSVLSI